MSERPRRYKLSVGFLPGQAALVEGLAAERKQVQGDIVRRAVDLLPFAEASLYLIRDIAGLGDAVFSAYDEKQMRSVLKELRVRARSALVEREAKWP